MRKTTVAPALLYDIYTDRMNDRLQQLALFVRTAETASFSKAGREFGLTQPSVSRAISALESRLGVKLLLRTTRQVSPTEAGELLLVRAREALAGIEDAENAARGSDGLSGIVRVALPSAYGTRRIVPLLPAFLERHPQLKVELIMSDRYANLIAEGVDLALRLGNQPDSSFITRKLESTRRLFIASPGYLARRGIPTTLSDLARSHQLIGGPADVDHQTWIARRGDAMVAQPVEPRIFTRSATGVVACAAAGLGVAVASNWMCGEEIASGSVVEILSDHHLEDIAAFVVFPTGRRPPQRARAFSDYLERTLAREKPEVARPMPEQ